MWHSWLFFCRSFYKGCEMFWKTGPEGYICETKNWPHPGVLPHLWHSAAVPGAVHY